MLHDTEAPEPMASGDDGSGDPPGTPNQQASAPASAAWRPRSRGGLDGGVAAVHWDSDVEANHTPGGSRRQRYEPTLVRRLWESLPAAAAAQAAGGCGGGGVQPGLMDKVSAVQGNLQKLFEGWELVAAFAAALILVNGIALSHASGPGVTLFQGPSWARPRSELPDWSAQHQLYVDELQHADKSGPRFELLFYGDSILETFRGTSRGGPCARCARGPEIYQQHFGSKYNSTVLAISGDTTGNLMWRLQHGESPAGSDARVMVLLIGANDLVIAAREGPDSLEAAIPLAASRIVSLVRKLLENARGAHVLLMPVLLGGDVMQPLPQLLSYPNRYSNATQQVNAIVMAELAHQRRVRIADCDYEALLLTPDRRSVQPEALPDGIHPSAKAWDALATACLDADLAQLLSAR